MQGEVFFSRVVVCLSYPILLAYAVLLMRKWVTCMSLKLSDEKHSEIESKPENSHPKDMRFSIMRSDRAKKQARTFATRMRLNNCRLMLKLTMHVSALYVVFIVLGRHFDGLWTDEYPGLDFSSDGLLVGIVGGLVGVALEVAPKWLTIYFMNFLHILAMSFCIGQVLAAKTAYTLVFRGSSWTAFRIGTSFTFGNFRLTVLLNALFSAAICLAYASYSMENSPFRDAIGSDHQLWFAFNEVFTSVTISVVSYGAETRALSVARANVKEKICSQAVVTSNALLTALCDAVVHLDRDFQVLGGLEKLQALLLKKPCKDFSFLDALMEVDKDKFIHQCKDSYDCDATSVAPSVHVGMRDANGVLVKTQLFVMRFPDPLDLENVFEYMIGVRELSREEEEIEKSISDFRVNQPQTSAATPVIFGCQATSPSNNSSEATSSNCSQTLMAHSSDEVGVIFDAMSFNIIQATPACTAIGGPSTIGANILDWLKDPMRFRWFTQDQVNAFMYAKHAAPPIEFGMIKLAPPFAARAQLEYNAQCSIDVLFWEGDENTSDEWTPVVRAHFTEISHRRRLKKGKFPNRSNFNLEPKLVAL